MKLFIYNSILVIFLIENLPAQQLPLFSQYRENQSILNPAALNLDYIRNDYNFSVGVSRRDQWGQAKLTLDNGGTYDFGPVTMTGRVEWIFPDDRFFVGGHVIQDKAGAISLLGAYLRAGYFILDPNYGNSLISLVGSISLGYNQFSIDYFKSDIYDYEVQYTDSGTPGFDRADYWDLSLGIFSWGEVQIGALEGDIIYGGVSIPQVMGLPLDNKGDLIRLKNAEPEQLVRLNVVGGIYKYLASETFLEGSINFNTLLKGKSPFTMTGNVRYHYRDWGWFGAGAKFPLANRSTWKDDTPQFRELHHYSVSTILIDIGLNLGKNVREVWDNRNIKVGIGYEFPIGSLLKELGNTIEFNLTYTLDTRGGRR